YNGHYDFESNVLNQLTHIVEPVANTTVGLVFAYDASGNRTRVEDFQWGVVSSVYDTANRLRQREFLSGSGDHKLDELVTLKWTDQDQIDEISRQSQTPRTPNGMVEAGHSEYSYDAPGRLIGLWSGLPLW